MDCCWKFIGSAKSCQWCSTPLRGFAIDRICYPRSRVIKQSNPQACFRFSLYCCPHLVWRAVTIVAMRAYMIISDIGKFLHGLV